MRRHAVLAILTLALSALACGLPAEQPPDSQAIQTQVAATLTALAEPEGLEPSPEPSATSMPSPSPEPPVSIAYILAGNLWVIQGETPPRQLTSSGGALQAVLSDDSTQVAFIHRGEPEGLGELRLFDLTTATERLLLSREALQGLYPPEEGVLGIAVNQMAFLPGSHDLVFNTLSVPEFIGLIKNDDLLRLDTASAALSTLLPAGSGGDFTIAPDGSRIAVTRPTQIDLVNSDGTNHQAALINFPFVMTYSEYAYYPRPVWSPDSGQLAVLIPSEDPLAPDPSATIWRIPAGGGPASEVATIQGQFFFLQMSGYPLISPDLARVAYAVPTGVPNTDNLVVANLDGSSPTVYDTGRVGWEGWAPDGMRFLYRRDTDLNLFLGALGSGPVAIGAGRDARWLDPQTFVYNAQAAGGGWDLVRYSAVSGPTILAHSPDRPIPFAVPRP